MSIYSQNDAYSPPSANVCHFDGIGVNHAEIADFRLQMSIGVGYGDVPLSSARRRIFAATAHALADGNKKTKKVAKKTDHTLSYL